MKGLRIDRRELVRKYGTNSNSFFALYPGFSSYPSRSGGSGVAYLRTRHAHLGVTEPFAPEGDRLEVLEEFFRYSDDQGADALALPIGSRLAKMARSRHLEVIPIGTEVLFDLNQMAKRGDDWVLTVPAARQLADRGGGVREILTNEITDELRLVLGEIYQDWNASKQIPPLGFLNRIEPWTLAEDKKLFIIEVSGRVVAFLSGLPIWSRNGWYLVDLIRSPKAPVGATELLLLDSMRILHEQKFDWVSLGVAPLADLKEVQFSGRKILYHLMHWMFEYDSDLYSCKSLYQFKLKFRPTHLEPAYLVAARETSLLRIVRALSEAYLPSGVIGTVFGSAVRTLRRMLGFRVLDQVMDPEMVMRPLPSGISGFLGRSIFSIILITTWIIVYGQTLHEGVRVDPGVISGLGFSWHQINEAHWSWLALRRVIFSGFFHEDFLHLATNIAMMVLVGPVLEMLWGEVVFLVAFLLPMWLGNVLTAGFFQMVSSGLSHSNIHIQVERILSATDVGASLGIFGCFGALLYSLRQKGIWAVSAVLVILAYAFWSGHWIHVNHLVAMLLGFAVVNLLQWRKRLALRYA